LHAAFRHLLSRESGVGPPESAAEMAILLPALVGYVLVVSERICSNEGGKAEAFIQPV